MQETQMQQVGIDCRLFVIASVTDFGFRNCPKCYRKIDLLPIIIDIHCAKHCISKPDPIKRLRGQVDTSLFTSITEIWSLSHPSYCDWRGLATKNHRVQFYCDCHFPKVEKERMAFCQSISNERRKWQSIQSCWKFVLYRYAIYRHKFVCWSRHASNTQ